MLLIFDHEPIKLMNECASHLKWEITTTINKISKEWVKSPNRKTRKAQEQVLRRRGRITHEGIDSFLNSLYKVEQQYFRTIENKLTPPTFFLKTQKRTIDFIINRLETTLPQLFLEIHSYERLIQNNNNSLLTDEFLINAFIEQLVELRMAIKSRITRTIGKLNKLGRRANWKTQISFLPTSLVQRKEDEQYLQNITRDLALSCSVLFVFQKTTSEISKTAIQVARELDKIESDLERYREGSVTPLCQAPCKLLLETQQQIIKSTIESEKALFSSMASTLNSLLIKNDSF